MRKAQLVGAVGVAVFSSALMAGDHHGGAGRVALDSLDTDGDGVVSFAEFQASDANFPTEIDHDGNGLLTLDEFLNLRSRPESAGNGAGEVNEERIARHRERITERLTARFHAMDGNGDEIVSADEFQQATFERMDRNDDAVLTARELRRHGKGRRGRGARSD